MSLDNLRAASTLGLPYESPIDPRLRSRSRQLRVDSASTTAIFENDRANRNDY
jgi:hypothetical protein